MHLSWLHFVVGGAWLLFSGYWAWVNYSGTMPTPGSLLRTVAMFIYSATICAFDISWSAVPYVPMQVIGFGIFAFGLGFAINAREIIEHSRHITRGRSWADKLVVDGPFVFVRHPIHLGMIIAMIGTGLATSFVWLTIVPFAAGYLVWRIVKKEPELLDKFPRSFSDYREEVPQRLIPYVW